MKWIIYVLGFGIVLAGTGCSSHDYDHDRDYRGGAYDGAYRSYGREGVYDDAHRWENDPWEHHDYFY